MIRLAAPFALLSLAAPLSLAACAAAPPPAAAPEPPPPAVFAPGQPREVSPVDQEMLAIGRAEEEIDRMFPSTHRKGGPPPPPPPASVAPGASGDARAAVPGAPGKEETRGDACGVACRALSSMVASAEKLCRLAGETDGRCEDAQARVRGAMGRVKTACPGCSVSPAPEAPRSPPKAPTPPAGPAPGMPGASSTIPIP
jgi:hypothetical protein